MDKRIKIGLVYDYNENWIGGTYYVENIIQALNTLDDNLKPEIFIFTSNENTFLRLNENLNYPYLKKGFYPKFNIIERIINKLSRIFNKYNIIQKNISDLKFIGLNPAECFHSKQIYWIPDFQDLYLPSFFNIQELKSRQKFHLSVLQKGKTVVFSSNDSKNDFLKFYSSTQSNLYVLPFAVTHPQYESLDFETLRQEYKLPEKYFFCPNQFWVHKNHLTLLKAIKVLKDKGRNIFVAFSGKEYEYRNPTHFDSLIKFVEENELKENVKFLGFIDRRHQLKLMSRAICIIQPSLFEGWSTVIEDAKAMNQFIIASDIAVHKEQLNVNSIFFNPKNANELSDKIEFFLSSNPQKINFDYNQNIREFGMNFLKMVYSNANLKFENR